MIANHRDGIVVCVGSAFPLLFAQQQHDHARELDARLLVHVHELRREAEVLPQVEAAEAEDLPPAPSGKAGGSAGSRASLIYGAHSRLLGRSRKAQGEDYDAGSIRRSAPSSSSVSKYSSPSGP